MVITAQQQKQQPAHRYRRRQSKHRKSIEWLIFFDCHQINRSHFTVCIGRTSKHAVPFVGCRLKVCVILTSETAFSKRMKLANESLNKNIELKFNTTRLRNESHWHFSSEHTHQPGLAFSFVWEWKNENRKTKRICTSNRFIKLLRQRDNSWWVPFFLLCSFWSDSGAKLLPFQFFFVCVLIFFSPLLSTAQQADRHTWNSIWFMDAFLCILIKMTSEKWKKNAKRRRLCFFSVRWWRVNVFREYWIFRTVNKMYAQAHR